MHPRKEVFRFAWIVFVGACALCLAAFSVRTAAVRTLPPTSPLLRLLAPTLPENTFQTALMIAETGRGKLDEQAFGAIRRAAQARPLDERPFFLVALRALADGDSDRGLLLLKEARRRNPRFRIARVLLLDRWLQIGDVADASAEMTVLARLLPGAQSVLVTELARMGLNSATSVATRRALAGDTQLLDTVLGAMARQGASPVQMASFAGVSSPTGMQVGGWRRTMIDELIARGDFASARSTWFEAAHVSSSNRNVYVFDSALNGSSAPPPFNWKLAGDSVGAATISKGVMNVNFYGRSSGELASQLLVLPPGRYQLSSTEEGLDSGDGSGLNWTITCSGAEALPLLSTPPVTIKPTANKSQEPFEVPTTKCGAQWLKLVGTAGEFASSLSVRVLTISIEKKR